MADPLYARMRAFLLATSAGQRARLMLPTGLLSGVALPVTSIYVASEAGASSCEFLRSVSRPTVWKGASFSFHSTLAFSTQKLAITAFAPVGHIVDVEKLHSEIE